MSTRAKQIIKLCARILVAAVLLTWVFSRVDLAQFGQALRTARWHYLLGVWAFTAVFFGLQSLAMQSVLKRQDCRVSVSTLFGASVITALYSLVLPGILSTGVKWYILKRHTGKGSNVLTSMLYNQVMLSVVMTAIGLAGLILTNPTSVFFPDTERRWVLPVACAVLLAALGVLCVLVLNGRTGGIAIRLLTAVLRPLPSVVQEKGRNVLTQIAVFQNAGLKFHLTIASINTVAGLLVGLLIYLFAAGAAYVDVSVGILIWLCAIVFILSKVPISVANLGVRELTLVGLLTAYGVSKPASLLMSMILFSALIFMAALGVLYQLFWLAKANRQGGSDED